MLNHLGTASTAEKFMAIVPNKARSSKFLLLSKSKRLMRCGYFFYKLFFLLLRTFAALIYLFMFHCHVLNNMVILTTSLAFSFVHLSYCINLRILSFFIHHVRISHPGINIPKARNNQSEA